jgi:aryl-alcohol dehydrogenase-like predicted oxidoreductase
MVLGFYPANPVHPVKPFNKTSRFLMQTRKLGYTDLHFTTIGLGTWVLGGDWHRGWGPQDDKVSVDTIHRAIDLGVNWLDTAPIYGLGHSEEVVGMALRGGWREKVFVATKCCRHFNAETKTLWNDYSPASLRTECEDSLRRLGVETIDLYQIHWAPEGSEEAWAVMPELVRQGKIRYAGVSNCTIEQMEKMQAIYPIASLQPPYSMLRRGIEDEVLAFCARNQIGVIPYGPMEEGLLSGKMTRERIADLAATDWRRTDPRFTEPQLTRNIALVDGLRPIAERNGLSVAQLAIAWTLRRPEVTSAIVGARRPEQIEETAAAGDVALAPADLAAIEALLAA